MEAVSDLGLKVLFLLIPGIIAFSVVKSMGPKQPKSDFESGLQIFIYGALSYAFAGVFWSFYDWHFSLSRSGGVLLHLLQSQTLLLATVDSRTNLSDVPIFSATWVSVVFGVVASLAKTHSFPHRTLRWLRLTRRTGEVDIWDFTLNSPDVDSWVTVRHHDNGKVYQGWIRGYSDGADERELLLADVIVYSAPSDDASELEQVDTIQILYLGLDRQNTTLEFFTKSSQSN